MFLIYDMATKHKNLILLISDIVLKLHSFFHILLQFIATAEGIHYPFSVRITCALKLMSQNESQTLQG